LFPAQALAKELKDEGYEVLFVGSGLASNPYFKDSHYPFKDIASSSLSKTNPWKSLTGIFQILKGMAKSYWVMRRFKPHLVVGFGSYQTVPALLTAKFLKTPILLHEANAVPGKVNRYISPYAKHTAVTFETTSERIRGETTVVRLPLSKRCDSKTVSREDALDYYQLEGDRLTILIFGGSQGARKLNELAYEALVNYVIPKVPNLQILHFTGRRNRCEEYALGYEKAGVPSILKPFEEQMEYAWMLADVSLTRAGASSVAEQQEYGVPGILVPFPYATDDHQAQNAAAFIEATGGAEMYRESELTAEQLGERLTELCSNETHRRNMRTGIMTYHQSRSTESLSDLVHRIMFELG